MEARKEVPASGLSNRGFSFGGKRCGVSDWGSSTQQQAKCPRTPQPLSSSSLNAAGWGVLLQAGICTAKTKAKRMLFGAFPNQQFGQVTTVTDEPCHHPKVSIQLLKSFPLKYEQMTMDHKGKATVFFFSPPKFPS